MTSNETDQPNMQQTAGGADTGSDQMVAETAADLAEVLPEAALNTDADAVSEIPGALPGSVLAARRNELRLTLEDVSQRLKLAPRQIIALEADDFASLPGIASVRGFIRSYAKLLELDPAPLLAMMSGETNPAAEPIVLRRPLPSQGFPGRRYAPPSGHRRGSRRLSGIALLMLVFVGALAYVTYRHDVTKTFNFEVPNVSHWFRSLKWNDSADTQPDDASTQPGPAEVIAAQKTIDPSRLLELRLREDAWVEISTLNGNKLVSRLMKAGSTEQFDMTEPVVLIVGNASGVDASLRGQPLNLRAVARDNVSKLSLK